MSRLYLSRIHYPVTTLGPGRRIGIWFQGCSIRCPGCISADTWAANRGETSVAETLLAIAGWLPDADGITVTGGEPFEQPDALLALLALLPGSSDRHFDVLVYTGFPWEKIASEPAVGAGLIDVLITDPYIAAAPQTKAFRGSDNQRMRLLTDRGRARAMLFDRDRGPHDDALDVGFDASGEVWFAGIPRPNDFHRLKIFAAENKASLRTTFDRRR